MSLPRIKVCCISSIEESRQAVRMGAAAVGLVGPMPSGPGIIRDEDIRVIAAHTPPPVATFLLSGETDAASIAAHHAKAQTNTLQLVDAVPEAEYAVLRSLLPGVKIVQVVHVLGECSVEEALQVAPHVDALLLDSGNPFLEVKVLGGTGKTHDWAVSRQICRQSPIPVFLAGGLHAGNVRRALDEVDPYGLDLCSGVRSDGHLDIAKLEAFFKAVGY
ncbi:MAG: phosphoribosylanthranilate isomerase [Saprospiraceae bacterium]